MDCRKFQKEISAVIITESAMSIPTAMNNHFRQCPTCSVEYSRQKNLLQLLRNHTPPAVAEAEWLRVHEGILAAI